GDDARLLLALRLSGEFLPFFFFRFEILVLAIEQVIAGVGGVVIDVVIGVGQRGCRFVSQLGFDSTQVLLIGVVARQTQRDEQRFFRPGVSGLAQQAIVFGQRYGAVAFTQRQVRKPAARVRSVAAARIFAQEAAESLTHD